MHPRTSKPVSDGTVAPVVGFIHIEMMSPSHKALAVHLLTATGAVLAMLAMLAAVDGNWDLMWFWLVVAFAVDGIDGPLARRYEVDQNAPRYDGALMDLIIDYITYVFIPAYALFASGLLPEWAGWFATILIIFASIIYFADTGMKTRDYSFSGFPGCWNMAVLVFFALEPSSWVILLLVVLLAISMFLPLKFVHPVRTARWRKLTLPATSLWVVLAGLAVATDFNLSGWAEWALAATSIYLVLAGVVQQALYGPNG